ncbi:MAG: hypothetical protein NWR72_21625 [Bacteroidia bacterium]|nr:hypothetical protein [Bacteroidia bacterium]
MKQLSLLLLLTIASLSISLGQNGSSRTWAGQLLVSLKGYAVDQEQLSHEIFCLDGKDTLTINYLPTAGNDGEYVILGIEIWGQVALGSPSMLAQVPAGESGNPASIVLPLATYIPPHLLPDGGKATRIMLRVRRIIEVDGKRYLGHYDVPAEATDFTFLLTKTCN